MARKVDVRNPDGNSYQVRRLQADLMVHNGLAKRIDAFAIEIVSKSQHRKRGQKASHQGGVYELAAIDKFPRIYLGGLTRTEHQPSKHHPFKGARVNHQP